MRNGGLCTWTREAPSEPGSRSRAPTTGSISGRPRQGRSSRSLPMAAKGASLASPAPVRDQNPQTSGCSTRTRLTHGEEPTWACTSTGSPPHPWPGRSPLCWPRAAALTQTSREWAPAPVGHPGLGVCTNRMITRRSSSSCSPRNRPSQLNFCCSEPAVYCARGLSPLRGWRFPSSRCLWTWEAASLFPSSKVCKCESVSGLLSACAVSAFPEASICSPETEGTWPPGAPWFSLPAFPSPGFLQVLINYLVQPISS